MWDLTKELTNGSMCYFKNTRHLFLSNSDPHDKQDTPERSNDFHRDGMQYSRSKSTPTASPLQVLRKNKYLEQEQVQNK